MPVENPIPNPVTKKSNKTLLIAIAALVVLALAGIGGYLFMNNSKDNSTGNSSSNSSSSNGSSNNSSTESTTSKDSLNNLFKSGRNVSCSVKYNETTGSIYLTSKKFYGEFTGDVDGDKVTTYVIQADGYSYIWGSSGNQGIKTKVEEEDKIQNQTVDENEQGDVNCSNWSVDNSKFTPPSNIEFMDYSVPASN